MLLNFWQFTLKTLDEIDLVSNQNLSIEMFLIRLLYLSDITKVSQENSDLKYSESKAIEINLNNQTRFENKNDNENNGKTISQIKNIFQEKN